ncbi:MAG: metallophosphoesterase family protein [Natronosporangium sp.]
MTTTMYGPRPGEGPAPRVGPVDRVAVLSDVHANVPALTAVLAEVERAGADLVVFCGDLTWGAEPDRTVELVTALGDRARFVRGNGERAVVDMARGERVPERERDRWMVTRHSPGSLDFVASFPFSLVVDVTGLGPVRFCHGSPRSDTEVVTPGTPAERITALTAGIDEPTLVTGHTHLQFDRTVAGRRSINPGSVGLPYHEGEPGTAYWALLGPDVQLRQTRYDVAAATAVGVRVGDPAADRITELITSPPTPTEVIDQVEPLVFSD